MLVCDSCGVLFRGSNRVGVLFVVRGLDWMG